MDERQRRIMDNTVRYIREKSIEKKSCTVENLIEKQAFYGRRGMRAGSFLTNRAVIGEEDGILIRQAALTSEQRNAIPNSQFGMPEQRKFPMPDEDHVLLAWKSVNRANITEGEKVKLRQRILARAKELKMDTKGWQNI